MKHLRTLAFLTLVALLLIASHCSGKYGAKWWQHRSSHYAHAVNTLAPPTGFSQLTIPPPKNDSGEFTVGDRVDILINLEGKDEPLLLDCLITAGPNPLTLFIPANSRFTPVIGNFLLLGQFSMRRTVSTNPEPIGLETGSVQ